MNNEAIKKLEQKMKEDWKEYAEKRIKEVEEESECQNNHVMDLECMKCTN